MPRVMPSHNAPQHTAISMSKCRKLYNVNLYQKKKKRSLKQSQAVTDPGRPRLSLETSKSRCPRLFAYPDAISAQSKFRHKLKDYLLLKSQKKKKKMKLIIK